MVDGHALTRDNLSKARTSYIIQRNEQLAVVEGDQTDREASKHIDETGLVGVDEVVLIDKFERAVGVYFLDKLNVEARRSPPWCLVAFAVEFELSAYLHAGPDEDFLAARFLADSTTIETYNLAVVVHSFARSAVEVFEGAL